MNRADLGWAVFLSLPVGVGVWLAVQRTAGGRGGPVGVAAGVVAALAVFLVVVGGAIDWSGEDDGGE